ncbi:hypothetical protein BpHYR1_053102 [Brachionus plicatilis]|uniref:Uncharacterized protein n=1 Tax=Brachionus plicatilis TaxID=10195 RepID=A0A3M7R4X7_BRAPC|nr:hypothetical protein BpHYR1_053102 [Brachionus plicatilis]
MHLKFGIGKSRSILQNSDRFCRLSKKKNKSEFYKRVLKVLSVHPVMNKSISTMKWHRRTQRNPLVMKQE